MSDEPKIGPGRSVPAEGPSPIVAVLTTIFAAEPIQEIAGWMGKGLGDFSAQAL